MSCHPQSKSTPKAYFTRGYTFSASHRLDSEALTAEENRSTFGKCNNPYGHGHNYRIEVTVGGPVTPETGMVVNMVTLDTVVRKSIVDRFDHMNLNLDPLFQERASTTENLCIAVYELLSTPEAAEAFRPAALETVRIEETENNFFEYSGTRAGARASG
jgi:6-pyruvoyltetrahydropterin/6-carboxytetrahydropterin synthase